MFDVTQLSTAALRIELPPETFELFTTPSPPIVTRSAMPLAALSISVVERV